MSHDSRLAKWRSWLDKESIPEDWDRNLWDEFYALLDRREMWNGYRRVVDAAQPNTQQSARWLTRWVLRNHLETQAMAIRRIAHRTKDPRPVSLVRLLDEIASHPDIIDADATEAKADADAVHEAAEKVTSFANKVVAHFDHDHTAASRNVVMPDVDAAVDKIVEVWGRWYPRVTGHGVATELLPLGWEHAVRLHRRDVAVENPGYLAAMIIYRLGQPRARELLRAFSGSPEERATAIAGLRARPETAELAESLMDIERDQDERLRLQLVQSLRKALGPS